MIKVIIISTNNDHNDADIPYNPTRDRCQLEPNHDDHDNGDVFLDMVLSMERRQCFTVNGNQNIYGVN